VLVSIGVIGTATLVLTPRHLLAGEADQTARRREAENPSNQRVIDLLAELIARSVRVIAIHQRGSSPYLELVLWLQDVKNPGRIDPEEIIVLSHSEALQTLWCFEGPAASTEATDRDTGAWARDASPSDIARRSFCRRWRERPDVRRRVLATGVAAMSVEPVKRGSDGRTMIRISLTWASETSDGPDEAGLVVDAVMPDEIDA
jgi:hypothetical protein